MFERQNTNMNNFDFDNSYTGDNGINYNDIDINMMQQNEVVDNNMNMMGGCCSTPISECPQERQVHRTIMHEVPHVCPIKTRIINHHVYRHTYRPEYSCCEENVVSNIQCGSCSQFR